VAAAAELAAVMMFPVSVFSFFPNASHTFSRQGSSHYVQYCCCQSNWLHMNELETEISHLFSTTRLPTTTCPMLPHLPNVFLVGGLHAIHPKQTNMCVNEAPACAPYDLILVFTLKNYPHWQCPTQTGVPDVYKDSPRPCATKYCC
jgi:hypothetical protein